MLSLSLKLKQNAAKVKEPTLKRIWRTVIVQPAVAVFKTVARICGSNGGLK